ncbi:MAG: hypothetical protein HY661_13905 [Betaproteobacteria bacterium]|nr:hypothetical protein [Betaproteobacteria bacterium]
MVKILSGLLLFLPLCSAFAVAENPPAEGSGSLGTIIFGIVFLAFCIGFIWMIWRQEKKSKQPPK